MQDNSKDRDMTIDTSNGTAKDWQKPELETLPISRTQTGVGAPGESGLPVPLAS